jgi:hypothetical protein
MVVYDRSSLRFLKTSILISIVITLIHTPIKACEVPSLSPHPFVPAFVLLVFLMIAILTGMR